MQTASGPLPLTPACPAWQRKRSKPGHHVCWDEKPLMTRRIALIAQPEVYFDRGAYFCGLAVKLVGLESPPFNRVHRGAGEDVGSAERLDLFHRPIWANGCAKHYQALGLLLECFFRIGWLDAMEQAAFHDRTGNLQTLAFGRGLSGWSGIQTDPSVLPRPPHQDGHEHGREWRERHPFRFARLAPAS